MLCSDTYLCTTLCMTVLPASSLQNSDSLHFVYTDKGDKVVFWNDSILCQVALCHIQHRHNIHSYWCQNLISYTVSKYFRQCGNHATMVWRVLPLRVEETAYRWAMMGSCIHEQSRTADKVWSLGNLLLDAGLNAPTSNKTSNVCVM